MNKSTLDKVKEQAIGSAFGTILRLLKIEPSLAGIIKATGNDPDHVFKAVEIAADKTPEAVAAILNSKAQLDRIEAKLDFIIRNGNGRMDGFTGQLIDADGMPLLPAPQSVREG